MYAALARFGYGIAKSLRPSKIKKVFKSKPKIEKKGDGFDKFRTMDKLRTKSEILLGVPKTQKIAKGVEGLGQKAYKGYRKAYGAALGTSTRRKVTSSALGGYTIGQMFDDL
jgi:hypothetical protein